jgi:hypothetical protein
MKQYSYSYGTYHCKQQICSILTHCGPHGRYVTFPLKMWWTGCQISDFWDTLGLNGLYTALAPNSLRPAAGYSILVVCLWTSLLSCPTLNEWGFVRLWAVCVCVWAASLISARFVTFRKESVITERKNILGKIWFFQNYCWTIYPMFLRTFFSEKDDVVRETKIVPREKIQWKWKKLWGK